MASEGQPKVPVHVEIDPLVRPADGRIRMNMPTPIETQDAYSLVPESGAPGSLEAFQEILTFTSFPQLLNVDLTTYPQTWPLFRDQVLAKCATW